VVRLRGLVLEDLARHGLTPGPEDTPETLKERLNDLYLEDVRRLKDRQHRGQIPLRDYAQHAQAIKENYTLLSLPLELWVE
jgi:hypothetical protein